MIKVNFLPKKDQLKKYVLAQYVNGEYWFLFSMDDVTAANDKAKAAGCKLFEAKDVEEGE